MGKDVNGVTIFWTTQSSLPLTYRKSYGARTVVNIPDVVKNHGFIGNNSREQCIRNFRVCMTPYMLVWRWSGFRLLSVAAWKGNFVDVNTSFSFCYCHQILAECLSYIISIVIFVITLITILTITAVLLIFIIIISLLL